MDYHHDSFKSLEAHVLVIPIKVFSGLVDRTVDGNYLTMWRIGERG